MDKLYHFLYHPPPQCLLVFVTNTFNRQSICGTSFTFLIINIFLLHLIGFLRIDYLKFAVNDQHVTCAYLLVGYHLNLPTLLENIALRLVFTSVGVRVRVVVVVIRELMT